MICQKCNQSFPIKIMIDGEEKNLKSRKYCLVCSPYGSRNTKNLITSTHASLCPEKKKCLKCKKELPISEFYYLKKRNSYSWNCKSCDKLTTYEKRTLFRTKCINYAGGRCKVCGYNKSIFAMEFHHRDAMNKDFSIASMWFKNFDDVKYELDKCDLLCSNCHRELHETKTMREISNIKLALQC